MHGVSSALALAHGCGSLALRHAAAATAACRPTRQPVAAPAAARLDPIRRVAAAGSVAARGSVAGVRRRSMSGSGPPNGGMTAGSKPQQQPGAVGPAAAAPDGASAQSSPPEDVLLQYVVLRRDLWTEQGWPLGSIVAQACHAATAALWNSRNDPAASLYCAPEALDHMHKVVLEIKGETQLRNLATKLREAGVGHKLWVEQPEDFATALATAPARKSEVAHHFKKLKLCKGA